MSAKATGAAAMASMRALPRLSPCFGRKCFVSEPSTLFRKNVSVFKESVLFSKKLYPFRSILFAPCGPTYR